MQYLVKGESLTRNRKVTKTCNRRRSIGQHVTRKPDVVISEHPCQRNLGCWSSVFKPHLHRQWVIDNWRIIHGINSYLEDHRDRDARLICCGDSDKADS